MYAKVANLSSPTAHFSHTVLLRRDDQLDVFAAEQVVKLRLHFGAAAHFELTRRPQDITEMLLCVVRVGRVDDQDDVGLARE